MNGFMRHYLRVVYLIFSCSIVSQLAADEQPKIKRVHFYMVSVDGGKAKLYFEPGEYDMIGSPAFSADGQKLAFDGWASQKGECYEDAKILVSNSDGSNLKAIGRGVMPRWSPGGNRIVFSQETPDGHSVATMRADGSNVKVIEEGGWGAEWSPDGHKIVYSLENSFDHRGKANLRIYDLIEGTKSDLFLENERPYSRFYRTICWSPNSRWLCFVGRNGSRKLYEVTTVNAVGRHEGFKIHYQNINQPFANIAWHPRGTMVIFAAGSKPRKLFKFNPVDDKAPEPINIKVNGMIRGDVCFTPDGQNLLFTVLRDRD